LVSGTSHGQYWNRSCGDGGGGGGSEIRSAYGYGMSGKALEMIFW